MNKKKKYAILGNGVFWDINHFSKKSTKHTSKNFRKVLNACDGLMSQYLGTHFRVVEIKKVKENI